MKRVVAMAAGLWFLSAAPASAAEGLTGLWQMIYQQIAGTKTAPAPLALRVTETKDSLQFDYLFGKELELTMTFTVKLDGKPGVIHDEKGAVKGIAKLTKVSDTEYSLVLQSPNKSPEPGKLFLKEKGNVLESSSTALMDDGSQTLVVQVFARQVEEK